MDLNEISIDHPTGRENFSIVSLGQWRLAFSYRTLIGVRGPYVPWAVCENIWSTTTGKHLNYLQPDHQKRLGVDKFRELVERIQVELREGSV